MLYEDQDIAAQLFKAKQYQAASEIYQETIKKLSSLKANHSKLNNLVRNTYYNLAMCEYRLASKSTHEEKVQLQLCYQAAINFLICLKNTPERNKKEIKRVVKDIEAAFLAIAQLIVKDDEKYNLGESIENICNKLMNMPPENLHTELLCYTYNSLIELIINLAEYVTLKHMYQACLALQQACETAQKIANAHPYSDGELSMVDSFGLMAFSKATEVPENDQNMDVSDDSPKLTYQDIIQKLRGVPSAVSVEQSDSMEISNVATSPTAFEMFCTKFIAAPAVKEDIDALVDEYLQSDSQQMN